MRRERQDRSDYKFHKDIIDLIIAVLLHFKSTLWGTFHLHSGTPLCVVRTCTLLALFVIDSIRFRWDLSMVAKTHMPTQFNEHGELKNPLNGYRVETNTHQRSIIASTDAAAPILVSMEGYVRRFVTLTAPGLTVPVLTHTLVSGVRRWNIREAAKT